jgi:hypothetical protein
MSAVTIPFGSLDSGAQVKYGSLPLEVEHVVSLPVLKILFLLYVQTVQTISKAKDPRDIQIY